MVLLVCRSGKARKVCDIAETVFDTKDLTSYPDSDWLFSPTSLRIQEEKLTYALS